MGVEVYPVPPLIIITFLIAPLVTTYLPTKPLPPPPVAESVPLSYPDPAFFISRLYTSDDLTLEMSPFTSIKSIV